jgi:galactokinase
VATGRAPGRVTLAGDHVDYVGGRSVAMAIDRGVAVAVRRSGDGRWRVAALGQAVERAALAMAGDIADRPLAAAVALRGSGLAVPALEVAVTGDLPPAAGLSSSAAVVCATLVAALRLVGGRVAAEGLVAAALTAERDVVGIPCGDLDQRSLVHAQEGAALLLDAARGTRAEVAWAWPQLSVLVAVSGSAHDVGGAEYRRRRQAGERVCAALGVPSCQEIGERWGEVQGELRPLARHLATETRRADAAAAALTRGSAVELGRVMDASHRSLSSDCEVSTPLLDAMVAAARGVGGCFGARLTGAGLGGSIVALVDLGAVSECAAAVRAAGAAGPVWATRPAAGVVPTAADVVTAAGL